MYGVVGIVKLFYCKFLDEFNSKKSLKIGQHLPKLCLSVVWHFLTLTVDMIDLCAANLLVFLTPAWRTTIESLSFTNYTVSRTVAAGRKQREYMPLSASRGGRKGDKLCLLYTS